MRPHATLVALVVPAALLLAACAPAAEKPAAPAPTSAAVPSASTSTVSPTPTPTPSPTVAKPVSATKTAKTLKAKIPSIRKILTITEDNDPNGLIGRPNGYVDAAVIYDKTVSSCTEPGADCGATIERFATEADAKRRKAYLVKTFKDNPILGTEYDTLKGTTLLRVDDDIKPSLAKKYAAAFTR